jgi:hypothetical protein
VWRSCAALPLDVALVSTLRAAGRRSAAKHRWHPHTDAKREGALPNLFCCRTRWGTGAPGSNATQSPKSEAEQRKSIDITPRIHRIAESNRTRQKKQLHSIGSVLQNSPARKAPKTRCRVYRENSQESNSSNAVDIGKARQFVGGSGYRHTIGSDGKGRHGRTSQSVMIMHKAIDNGAKSLPHHYLIL